MKGCLITVATFFVGLLVLGGVISAFSGSHGGSSASDSNATVVLNSGPYLHKASSSVSRASRIVGNFPTGDDTADYQTGLLHISHLHEKLGSFTIYQVVMEGRAVRDQERADREHAKEAAQDQADKAKAVKEANVMHGDPDCLVLDRRSTHNESGDYVSYIVGTVTNNCDKAFSYAQVEINFYSDTSNSSALTGSTLANVNNLAPGQTWQFKAADLDGKAWRVEKVSGSLQY